jgi:hypothetical protein
MASILMIDATLRLRSRATSARLSRNGAGDGAAIGLLGRLCRGEGLRGHSLERTRQDHPARLTRCCPLRQRNVRSWLKLRSRRTR